ncbi:hypothetical protein ACTD5D_02495 [Nocardia takedensis]|uniref:hypothetical protein n=1 Tax=Nocardia TaxID=1817 RepID=UPI00245425D5|nr:MULTISPECIES: hypothetical protein [Nocardia]
MVDRNKSDSDRFAGLLGRFALMVQCGIGFGLLIMASASTMPELIGTDSTAQRFGLACLIGVLAAIVLDPAVRYIRAVWRGDRED